MIKLSAEEKDIRKSVESGDWRSIRDKEGESERYQLYARDTFRKDRRVNIRLAGRDRKRAIAIGEKLGIYRDYPVSKGCTSPFAPIWINEMVRRQR